MDPQRSSFLQVVQSEKLSERISRQLLETIIAGHYPPGELLPPERELAATFKVSRVAVREALSSLAAKGILSVRQGRGAEVNSSDQWNTLDPEVLMLLHGDKIFGQLVQMRLIFEPELAALAAENICDEELETLRKLADLPDSDTVEQHVERDTAFHLAIARATHNPVLLVVLGSTSEILRESRRRTFTAAGEMPRARRWHQDIYAAIAAHDPQAARQAMTGHIEQVRDALERYEPPAG
jgi:GntR family transcriptional regulator, transcriptional repressor for pyruvate dehydrogenase complex